MVAAGAMGGLGSLHTLACCTAGARDILCPPLARHRVLDCFLLEGGVVQVAGGPHQHTLVQGPPAFRSGCVNVCLPRIVCPTAMTGHPSCPGIVQSAIPSFQHHWSRKLSD